MNRLIPLLLAAALPTAPALAVGDSFMDLGDWSIYEREAGGGGCYADHHSGEPSRDGWLEFVDYDGRGLTLIVAMERETLPPDATAATLIFGEQSHEVPIDQEGVMLSASLDAPDAIASFASTESLEMVIANRSRLRLKLPGLPSVVEGLKLCVAARSEREAEVADAVRAAPLTPPTESDTPRPQPKPALPAASETQGSPAGNGQLLAKPVTSSVYVECKSKGQLCDNVGMAAVPEGARKIAVLIEAPEGHCSDIRYLLRDEDGGNLKTTAWLSPGASDFATVEIAGQTNLVIAAEGRDGGCNTGTLGSWAANIAIGVVEGAAAPVADVELPEGWAIIRDALACWIYQQSPTATFVLQRNPGSEIPNILLSHEGWDSWIIAGNRYAVSFRFGEDYLPLDAHGISVEGVDPSDKAPKVFLLVPEITSVVDRLKGAEAVTVTMEDGVIGTFPVSNFAAAFRATDSCR